MSHRVVAGAAITALAAFALAPAESTAAPTASTGHTATQAPARPEARTGSAERRAGSFSVSPTQYTGGQKLTFRGKLPVKGRRVIHLQQHLGRTGDTWSQFDNRWRTKRNGSFVFTFLAPSMFDIRFRVASGKYVTPTILFKALSQDLTTTISGVPDGLGAGQVISGAGFMIDVDTTPKLPHRPDLPGPTFRGRKLTLQRQGADLRWTTVQTSMTDLSGQGSFAVVIPGPSTVTYRVREENWTGSGSKIGWFPSFPFVVDAIPMARLASHRVLRPKSTPVVGVARSVGRSAGPARSGAAQNAGSTYKWGTALWDYNWAFGESLTTGPGRGTDPRGTWLDTTTGLGRVAPHNGQIGIDSQRNLNGPGDFGTTTATVQGNPMKYGRWEAIMRMKRLETGGPDFHALLEVVPASAADYDCGAQNITVADITAAGNSLAFGVKARSGTQWTATKSVSLSDGPHAYAVELSKNHITWFFDSKVMGTVKSTAAVSDVPMTLRLSLVGNDGQEMNHTQLFSDWERGFSLDRGALKTGGASLNQGTFDTTC